MKITPQQYAKALYELTRDKNQEEVNGVIAQLVEVLKKNGQLRLKNNIVKKYNEIYNRENGIVEAEVISREALSDEMAGKICAYVTKKYGAKETVLCNIIDQEIKGGVIIRVGDEILDGSVNRQLAELQKSLESNL